VPGICNPAKLRVITSLTQAVGGPEMPAAGLGWKITVAVSKLTHPNGSVAVRVNGMVKGTVVPLLKRTLA
jgi:hypothetical protein